VKSVNKIVLLLFLSFYNLLTIDCQTVDSVRAERIGNLVKIKYILLNSNPDQHFTIKVYCSINGGSRFEPESLSGDIGENITGGRSEYTIIWDVLKDVEELISAEFFVRADLKDKRSEITINWSKQKAYGLLAVAVGPNNLQGGLRLALLNKWGASFSFMAGQKKYRDVNPERGDKYGAFTTSIDATRQVIQDSTYRMHIFSGLAIANEENPEGGASFFKCGPELGLALEMRRVAFFTNISYVKFLLNATSVEPYGTFFLSFGIGLRPR
jgi:hypothetical protein